MNKQVIQATNTINRCIQLLKEVEPFRNVPGNLIEDIAKKMVLSSYPANETIIHQGDLGDSMFVILKGRVKIHEGKHSVAEMSDTHFFGEQSILYTEPRSMSVTTIEPTSIYEIHQSDIYQVLKEHPDTFRDLIGVLSNRMHIRNQILVHQLREHSKELEEQVIAKTKNLTEKNKELSTLLLDLKKTQEQLITQEKLATLGHLTAGIAHEIQNPLNFITNFSTLTLELLDEYIQSTNQDERDKLLKDLTSNLQKIHEHGLRADSIVKNMMLHSRTKVIEKSETDINRLLGEFIELAYHGILLKDPKFECKTEMDLDPRIPLIHIHQQNISRVILNLLGNAFYTVNKKSKLWKADYTPFVKIRSSLIANHVQIDIEDNGEGIPESEIKKLFQPFFTTKPMGEGTGLGLSLSHDVITKEHGGSITVKSKEGSGSTFTIRIPVAT